MTKGDPRYILLTDLTAASIRKYYTRVTGKAPLPGEKSEFIAFMKEHRAEWQRSDEFASMFTLCPPDYLYVLSRAYYGDGNLFKGGMNLSERVVECLRAAHEQFTKEQHTFVNARMVEIVLDQLGIKIDGEKEAGWHTKSNGA